MSNLELTRSSILKTKLNLWTKINKNFNIKDDNFKF